MLSQRLVHFAGFKQYLRKKKEEIFFSLRQMAFECPQFYKRSCNPHFFFPLHSLQVSFAFPF